MLWARPISVTMPQELLDYLDEIADINNMSRSEMMRTLIEEKRKQDMKCQMAQEYGSNVKEV